jgi:hypothetical protein
MLFLFLSRPKTNNIVAMDWKRPTKFHLKRRRKHFDEGYNCVLCHEKIEEIVEHLFFDCSSVVTHWFATGITWNENLNVHQKI